MAEETAAAAPGKEKSADQVYAEWKAQKNKELLKYTGIAILFFAGLYVVNKIF